MRLPVKNLCAQHLRLGLIAAAIGAAVPGVADAKREPPLAPPANGPAADYPIVIGEPYEIKGITYAPSDVWNYDQVGYAALDTAGGSSITGADHTLPVPSYVEVTSLETGKTILVRIERRGPMDSNSLIALSPGAADQLGATAGTPVRVRRVNPPEPERAALREGQRAPERMATPKSLVEVLKRKLPGGDLQKSTNLAVAPSLPVAAPVAAGNSQSPNVSAGGDNGAGDGNDNADFDSAFTPSAPTATIASPTGAPATTAQPLPDTPKESQGKAQAKGKPPAPAQQPPIVEKPSDKASKAKGGGFVVQAGAFSTQERASRVAKAIGGKVEQSKALFLVRTGPFASKAEAEASLAKVKAAGYRDARIYSGG